MQIKLEFVNFNEELNTFEIDENSYSLELNEEDTQRYNLLKDTELALYKWLKESDVFLTWINEEVYQNNIGKKFAISDINGISFIRFYFFKVTSGDTHYDYFKKLFNICEEPDWQDREEIGNEILNHLSTQREELIIEIS